MDISKCKLRLSNKVYNVNILLIILSVALFFNSLTTLAQLNSEGNPPDEVLRTLAIKHPGQKATNWHWDKKYVEYVGYFKEDGKINEVHINGYGKWTKTITYLDKKHLPSNIIEAFENKIANEVILSEVFYEKSKDWGSQYIIRFINETENEAPCENEYVYSENHQLVAERTYKKHHIPFIVTKKFDDTYQNATKEKWSFNSNLFAFEVNFKVNKEKRTVYFSADGQWMWSENLAFDATIPNSIVAHIENSPYKDWMLDHVYELSLDKTPKYFRVKLKKQGKKEYLFFSTEGNLLNQSDL